VGRKRRRGHWCWCCERQRPNERFSGSGHARHLCKQCARLPKTEREVRQAIRDIDRIYRRRGKFWKKRPQLERFLNHSDERVRGHAQRALGPPDWLVAVWREEEEWEEQQAEMWGWQPDEASEEDQVTVDTAWSDDPREIPF